MLKEINCEFPVNPLGYGVVGRNILIELSKKVRTNLYPIGPVNEFQQEQQNVLTADFNAPTIKIWHQNQLFQRFGNGRYFGWPIFELNTFNPIEKASLSCPHELIVCSQWAKEVCESNRINKPIHVVPLGVDRNIFQPKDKLNSGTYKFFTIGKNELRKGHDIISKCFNSAFDDDDDVELHYLTNNVFLGDKNNEWYNLFKTGPLSDKVFIHGPLQTHQDVAKFIQDKDCGVFPARAEGWNLELLESMACAKNVITTNYAAHTEFSNKDNAMLVEIDRLEPANDGVWFHGEGYWAHLGKNQEDQIIEYMREAYKENYRTNNYGLETASQFTWENSVNKLLKNII